eukprot:Phypoly_transcript_00645.p1 GENE.Phypoly_transcript_00645~~Phypoly_transcript_00645.p1  ORF type:complete len:1193 (+),score=294.56 Phypoly_transcript_00645:459-4037(+)
MNGILRSRVSSCATPQHVRVVLYSSSPSLPHSIFAPPSSVPQTAPPLPSASQTPPQISPNDSFTSDPKSLPLPNGALSLPHGLTIRKKVSTVVTYRDLTADQLLDVIYKRKEAGEPQELLNFIYLIMEYRKTNNTQGIMNAVVLMKEVGVEPNLHIFNMLITYFGLLKDPNTVKELIKKMRNKGYDLSDSNYNVPIQAFLTSGIDSFYQDAIDTFHWAMRKGVALKQGTYFSLLSSAVGKGDDAVVQQILADMLKHGLEPPDSKDIFNMYITARTLNRDYKGVLQKYAEMRSLGLFPSYPAYVHVFKSGSMLHEPALIRAAWKDLRSTMGPAPLIATSVSQYCAYIRALALAGDTQGCLEALAQLRADGLKPVARCYIPVLEVLVRRKDAEGIAWILNDAKSEGIEFNGLLLENATQVIGGNKLDDIRKQGKQPTVTAYNTQLAKLAKDGDHDGLMRTMEEMTRDGIAYDVTTYNTLLLHAANNENNEEIRRLHAKMVAEGIRPDASLYNTLAQSYARMKDAPACAKLVDAMLREGVQLHTQAFQPVISLIVENNDMERCYGMLTHLRGPSTDALDMPTYGRIIDLMLSKGDIVGCNRILSEMQTKGVKPSLSIYNSLIGFASQKGDKNWVSVLMSEISTQGLRADMSTYTRLFEGLAMVGDAEGCDAWVATMRTHGLSPSRAIYHNIISTKAMRGDAEGCGRIVREMGVRGMNPDPQAYAVTLHLLVRKGDQLNCRAVYEDMKGKGVVPDRATFNLVALISGTEDGLKLLADMRESAVIPDTETYRALLGSMAWRGDVEGCRRALAEMDRDGIIPDMATYNSLVANLGKHADTRVLCNGFLEGIPPTGFSPFANAVPPPFNPVPMYNPIPPPIPFQPTIMPPVVSPTPPPLPLTNVTITQDNLRNHAPNTNNLPKTNPNPNRARKNNNANISPNQIRNNNNTSIHLNQARANNPANINPNQIRNNQARTNNNNSTNNTHITNLNKNNPINDSKNTNLAPKNKNTIQNTANFQNAKPVTSTTNTNRNTRPNPPLPRPNYVPPRSNTSPLRPNSPARATSPPIPTNFKPTRPNPPLPPVITPRPPSPTPRNNTQKTPTQNLPNTNAKNESVHTKSEIPSTVSEPIDTPKSPSDPPSPTPISSPLSPSPPDHAQTPITSSPPSPRTNPLPSSPKSYKNPVSLPPSLPLQQFSPA